jgi:hypothetical protein
MSRNTFIAAITLALMVMAGAMYEGWSHYQAWPQGDLLYTPMGPCPSLAHSFTTGYLLVLTLAALICLVIAAAAFAASWVPRLSSFKRRLRSIAAAGLLIVGLLFVVSFLHRAIEAYLPLQVDPSCRHSVNSPNV